PRHGPLLATQRIRHPPRRSVRRYLLRVCLSPSQLEELRGIRNLTLSGGRGDLGEEQRVRLGAVRGVHRLERVHGALEVAQEETGVALEIVQIGVVGIYFDPLVRYLERCLGNADMA